MMIIDINHFMYSIFYMLLNSLFGYLGIHFLIYCVYHLWLYTINGDHAWGCTPSLSIMSETAQPPWIICGCTLSLGIIWWCTPSVGITPGCTLSPGIIPVCTPSCGDHLCTVHNHRWSYRSVHYQWGSCGCILSVGINLWLHTTSRIP